MLQSQWLVLMGMPMRFSQASTNKPHCPLDTMFMNIRDYWENNTCIKHMHWVLFIYTQAYVYWLICLERSTDHWLTWNCCLMPEYWSRQCWWGLTEVKRHDLSSGQGLRRASQLLAMCCVPGWWFQKVSRVYSYWLYCCTVTCTIVNCHIDGLGLVNLDPVWRISVFLRLHE